jgi:hypothetical protein
VTAAEWARKHGDPSTWSDADWETCDHLLALDQWDMASPEDRAQWIDPAAEPPASWLHRATTDTTTGETTR